MSIPPQFAPLYDDQVFVWSDCLLDLGTDFLVGNMGDTTVKIVERGIVKQRIAKLDQPRPNMAARVYRDTAREKAVNDRDAREADRNRC